MDHSEDVDKFASLIIPNCQISASQEAKLQSCSFAPQSEVLPENDVQSSEDAWEQATGVLMVSQSSEEYQTPPEHHRSHSENSSNDGHVSPAAVDKEITSRDGDAVIVLDDDDNDDDCDSVINLPKVLKKLPNENAHEVFVEMPEREQEAANVSGTKVDMTLLNKGKRKLPFSLNVQEIKRDDYSKHQTFMDSLNRVSKMLAGDVKSKVGGDVEIDFYATAKMRGMTFPRPHWWPPEGSEK